MTATPLSLVIAGADADSLLAGSRPVMVMVAVGSTPPLGSVTVMVSFPCGAGVCATAGLAIAPEEVAFCCAGDMPFAVDPALLDALFAALEGHDAAVPVNDGHLQPLCALYRREPCLAAASAALAAGPVGPRRLLDAVDTAQVPWADPKPFLDADTREDLARIATL